MLLSTQLPRLSVRLTQSTKTVESPRHTIETLSSLVRKLATSTSSLKYEERKPHRNTKGSVKSLRDKNAEIRMSLSERNDVNRAHQLRRRPSPSRSRAKRSVLQTYTLPDIGLSSAQLAALANVADVDIVNCARMLDGNVRSATTVMSPAVVDLVTEELDLNVKFRPQTVPLSTDEGKAVSTAALARRMPVVTVMGHVDHGKTSLLDALFKTDVAPYEAGGITQSVAAFRVPMPANMEGVIGETPFATFIDTPGHAAFSAMRANGTVATDIVVLVVAADDGVMPQTEEAAKLARAANVPIVIAINKCDVAGADPDRARFQLLQKLDLNAEQLGGDILCTDISARTGSGLSDLLDAIALQAEILDLRARVEAPAHAICLESRIDRAYGMVATVVVREGTLHKGDYIAFHSAHALHGELYGRVRLLLLADGKEVTEATPGVAVGVVGLHESIPPGSEVCVMANERVARSKSREILSRNADAVATLATANRIIATNEQKNRKKNDDARIMGFLKSVDTATSDEASVKANTEVGDVKDERLCVQVVVKGNLRGSADAVAQCVQRLEDDKIAIRILSVGVGDVNDADISFGSASHALKGSKEKCIIVAFNAKVKDSIRKAAKAAELDIVEHQIIYHLENKVKELLDSFKAPELREEVVGQADVPRVFSDGAIAGCMVKDGVLKKGDMVKVLRPKDNSEEKASEIYSGEIESIKQFSKEVPSVKKGFECGICLKGWVGFKSGDVIHAVEQIQESKTNDLN